MFIRQISPLIFILLLAGCNQGPPTPGTPTTSERVCDKSNDGKRLSLEGYVSFPQSFKSTEPGIMMRLRPTLDSRSNVVGISVTLGNAANQVEMPPKLFSPQDIKLHTADGNVAGFKDKVKVSGSMYTLSSLANVEFQCGLQNVLVEGMVRQ